ncbi:hypothetical protein [Bacillus tuaregi]|uniref:hypothetical protein n=1 Tax=Bacillus tuaregi TaxID=1816695 RepID=UPI0008F8803E|nr:hypothetical protein [Bacillus tuaregi]
MRIKIIISILLLISVTGCQSLIQMSTKNEDQDKLNSREMTEEEQAYIEFLLTEEYDELISITEDRKSEVKQDYYLLAASLKQYDEAEERKQNPDVTNEELELRYSLILQQLRKVSYIPTEIKDQIIEVKKLALYQKEYYANQQL